MCLKNFTFSIILVCVIFALPSCGDDEEFSGPTAKALDVKFGTGFEDDILRDVSIDKNGVMYVSSKTKIYKVDASGNATVFAGSNTSSVKDGQGTAATFRNIDLLSFDESGNIYAMDYQVIRKISTGGEVTSLPIAQPYSLLFKDYDDTRDFPDFLGVFPKGNSIYASVGTIMIKISGDSWNIFAGSETWEQGFVDGQGYQAKFNALTSIIPGASGDDLICSDGAGIRQISVADSTVITIAGAQYPDDSNGITNYINDIAMGNDGNYYLSSGTSVHKVTPTGTITTIAGPYRTDGSTFNGGGLAIDASGKYLYVADITRSATLIKIELKN